MSSKNNTSTYLIIFIIALLVAALLCVVGFGLGFTTGRWVASRTAEASTTARPVAPTDTPPQNEQSPVQTIDAPDNFDIFWEAIGHLQDAFDGPVPEGTDLTSAAITGLQEYVGECADPSEPIIQIKPPHNPRKAPDDFDRFWTAVNDLYRHCGSDMPAPDELVYASVNGVISQLNDRYTVLMPPRLAESFRISLNSTFEGIGAIVEPIDKDTGKGVVIVHPYPGSPAAEAGLKPGDAIIAVDGKDVTDMSLDEAVLLIRGPAGSDVVLTVRRDDQAPYDITVTRDRIDIPILSSEIRDDGLLYIQLSDFSPRATKEMRRALQEGIDAGVKGIILDLRGNPGGRLDVSIDIASMFIDEGVIVSEKGNYNQDHKATGKAVTTDLPLAVLVNGGSASASEIVAGAIQDHKRGVLIGERTFGKGSVQTIYTLSDGSLLKITVARWYTPDGRLIDGEGLTPDIVVPFPDPSPDAPDVQLQAAVEYLLDQIKSQ